MLPRKSGHIVNIASTSGQRSTILSGTYAATKHAVSSKMSSILRQVSSGLLTYIDTQVIGMTKTAGVEYAADGIYVNAVAPGCVKTQFLEQALSLGWSEESISDLFPIKRLADRVDIARAVGFLLESTYAVGFVVTVDGGHCS